MSLVTAVILAAGQSQRMGTAKLLLPWGHTTILEQTIQHVLAAKVDHRLLVSGGYRQEIEALAQRWGLPVVHNPNFAVGEMLSSLQTAVRHLPPRTAAVLVMLGDLPFVPVAILNQVVGAFRAGKGKLVAPSYEGRRGHPVLIAADFFDELLALPAGGAPRDLIGRHHLHLVEVASDHILRDIDTPEQYERWKPR